MTPEAKNNNMGIQYWGIATYHQHHCTWYVAQKFQSQRNAKEYQNSQKINIRAIAVYIKVHCSKAAQKIQKKYGNDCEILSRVARRIHFPNVWHVAYTLLMRGTKNTLSYVRHK